MFVRKGGEREERESRLRLAEQYQATSDAVARIAARVFGGKHPPRLKTPWYLETPGAATGGLTPETGLDDAIMGFARRTGRTVTRDDAGVHITATSRRIH